MKKFPLILIFLLLLGTAVRAQERPGERLRHSIIRARAPLSLRSKPRFGLPVRKENDEHCVNALCSEDFSELLTGKNGLWLSWNPDSELPNWASWDPDPLASRQERDRFGGTLPEGKFRCDTAIWNAVLAECYRWALEKPYGHASLVIGPVVSGKEVQRGREAIPAAFFIAICKKTQTTLGYKSIAFLLPNVRELKGGIYDYSTTVNSLEYRFGYDLFCKLPELIQEEVEEMTTYELYCPFQETDDGLYEEFEYEYDYEVMEYPEDYLIYD